MFCPNCGAEIKPGIRFCGHCGAEIPAGASGEQAQAPAPVQRPSSVPPQAPRKGANPKLVAVIAVIALALVGAGAWFLLGGGGLPGVPGSGAGGTSLEGARVPSVVDEHGTEIQALERPLFMTLVGTESVDQGGSGSSGGSGSGGSGSGSSGSSSSQSGSGGAGDGGGSSGGGDITPSVDPYTIQPGLSNVTNLGSVYLSDDAKAALEENGFVVVDGYSDEFFGLYETNRYEYRANFVTVDSMMHSYHLYFMHLLRTTEENYLASDLLELTEVMLAQSEAQLEELRGTEWEGAALRNVTFFSVANRILDDGFTPPTEVADVVDAEYQLIMAHQGVDVSPALSAGEEYYEDYSQYIPRGYYESTDQLQRYFRAMMWYGRMNFQQKDEDLDRSALLITLALDADGFETWEGIYLVTSFFAGASDDMSYYEYLPLFRAAYGEDAGVADLAGNDEAWAAYHELTGQMPAPRINSVPSMDDGEDHLAENSGFRFMGQRFSIDAEIFTQLIYNRTGENSANARRMLPDALDVPAALGSDEALEILESRGATDYESYSQNMQALRDDLADESGIVWHASLYSEWLYTLNPLLAPKGEGYPEFMQSEAWGRHNLETYLGSYTELKHDTVLYSKQAVAEMGGAMPDEYDDRGYVEPEPEVFRRLANLTEATSVGLSAYGMLSEEDARNLELLRSLSEQLAVIAQKELTGEEITESEYELIRSFGGQIEHFWQVAAADEGVNLTTRDFPSAIVVDVATDPNAGQVLELATGGCSTIYVVFPIDGELHIASGTVYNFYQFSWPSSDRLTDTAWREMMGFQGGWVETKPVDMEDWTRGYRIDPRY